MMKHLKDHEGDIERIRELSNSLYATLEGQNGYDFKNDEELREGIHELANLTELMKKRYPVR